MKLGWEAALTNSKELEFNAPNPPKMKIQKNDLKKFLPGVRENVWLKDYTTFRIGGPADFFYEAKTEKELIKAIRATRKAKTPFFILGRGSNILFDDKGFRGLVIRNFVAGIKVSKTLKTKIKAEKGGDAHYRPADPQKYLQFSDLDYPQEPFDTEVEVSSGVSLQHLIQWALENKLTGLQWFAGIPGSVGGGVVYNIHGGNKLFSNYIKEITVLDEKNKIQKIKRDKAGFTYDKSFFQKEKLIILKITLSLSQGDLIRANYVYKEWRQRKLKVQPQTNCAGSVFKNFSKEIADKIGAPTSAAGWFIDQAGLKGRKLGGVQVSGKHANFIVNLGNGTAQDVKNLIKLIKKAVKKKFRVELKEEILLWPEKIQKNK